MPRTRTPGRLYAGRRPDAVVVNFTIGREYAEKLRTFSGGPGNKRLGRFVEQLVQDYEARQRLEDREERLLKLTALLEQQAEAHHD